MITIFLGVIAITMIIVSAALTLTTVMYLKGIKEFEESISDTVENLTEYVESNDGLKKTFKDIGDTLKKFDRTLNNLATMNHRARTKTRSNIEPKN